MKINLHKIEEMKISEFANKHDLVMEVNERDLPVGHPLRFYACFAHTEVKDGCILIGTYGKVKKQPPDLTAGEFNRREC